MSTFEVQANMTAAIAEPGGDDGLVADPHREHRPEHRRGAGRERDRQQPDAGLERLVAAQDLEVLRDQEDEAEEREERERDRGRGGAEAGVAEQPHVEQRVRGPAARRRRTPPTSADGDDEAGERARREPALLGRLDDRVDERQARPSVESDQADPVDARPERVAGLRHVRDDERRTPATASGSFSQKAACQPLSSSSAPPTIGPSATAMPVVAPQRPIALARSPRSGNRCTIVESVAGKITAAPSPITARHADQRAARVDERGAARCRRRRCRGRSAASACGRSGRRGRRRRARSAAKTSV